MRFIEPSASVAAALLLIAATVHAQATAREPERQWFPTPSILPGGAMLAVVSGHSFGDTASAPAGVTHWSIAEGDTHLIVTEETGPYRIAYMNVRDEPGSHAFPNGY